jgi:hypothetical protein
MAFPSPYLTSLSTMAIDNIINAFQDLDIDRLDAEVSSTGSFESFYMVQGFDEALVVSHQMLAPPDMPEAQPFGVPGVPGGRSGATSKTHVQEPHRDEEA